MPWTLTRYDFDMQIGKAPVEDGEDVMHHGSGRRCDHADLVGQIRKGPLALRIEITLFRKPLF